MKLFETCRLCPRNCGTNRLEDIHRTHAGFCRESSLLRVAHVGPHFGEEPPITGINGSGTVFFSGCSLRCVFCQNYQISTGGLGEAVGLAELLKKVLEMIRRHPVHNINLVTPDHFFPYTFQLVSLLRQKGHDLPVIYNLSGYQSIGMLKMAEGYADIYLPDYKYTDSGLANRLSKCKDYPEVALEAIVEMVRQKGFLDSFENSPRMARKGVLVRHLILPGNVNNSLNALTTLYLEFGGALPISIMSQFCPVLPQRDKDLNRSLLKEEFDKVYSHALDLGFENVFVQYPDEPGSQTSDLLNLLPDFRQKYPFSYQKSLLPFGQ
ncbi:MAG: radical SAM protein [Thermodesulfobacteriota bacterium]|nr:radical SAM protein [Thermodesulfobacteriota bacterium]